MSDMVTIDTSNAILILLNLICVLSEIAIIAPSPASGTMSDGRYKNMPAAINTVLPSISIIRNTMLLGVGINPNKKLENVVKYPNTMPTAICSRFFILHSLLKIATCSTTKNI